MTVAARRALTPRARHELAIVAAAVLTPLGHLAYLAGTHWLEGYPLSVEPLSSMSLHLYLIALALTGVIVYLGWSWGLRFAPVLAVVALLVLPFHVHAGIGDDLYASPPFVIVLAATVLEGYLRFPERTRRFTAGPTGRAALTVGLLHFALGFGLQVYTRRFFWMDWTGYGPVTIAFAYVYSGLGLAAAGALAVILWRRERLVGPALALAGWFLWGLAWAWRMGDSLPLGAFTGFGWFYPVPYPDYLLNWAGLWLVLLAVAGGELAVRRVGRLLGRSEDNPTA